MVTNAALLDRKHRLAELVSTGLTVMVAARRMGIGKSYAYRIWAEIRADLGPQAI